MVAEKIVLYANTDWYLYNFRRSLALRLQHDGYEILLLSPTGPYGEKLRALGLRWEPLPMDRRSLNPIREFGLLWHLVRLFWRERPALVHGFTIKCAVYGSLAARLAGVPARINAVGGMGYVFTSSELKARALRPIVRLLLHWALGGKNARLVLQNADDVSFFEGEGLADHRSIRLIRGSGVNCAHFFRSNMPDTQRGRRPSVLLAARLLWDKGIAEYVESARILRVQGRDIRFLLAGTPDAGNPAAIPVDTVEKWVSEGLIEWLGHVDDMPALLSTIDVFALPSYREGLPKGLIEAGASGIPLVSTDVPGCREVITGGEDGLLVPVRDAAALAAAIARLIDDQDLATRLGAAARKKTMAEFEESIVIDRTLAVYRELLGTRV